MNKRVSVVIPCRNEIKHIETCLMSLLNNGYPKEFLELIVVDGLSDDGTTELLEQLAQKHPQIKWLTNPKQKTPFALNLGIQQASGYYTLISSAHASYSPNYINTLVEKIEKSSANVVGGVMNTKVKNVTPVSKAIELVLAHPFGVGNAHFRTGVSQDKFVDTVPFGMYKTELLKHHEGYNEKLIRNHDIELSKRLIASGTKILLTPDARCTYYARETWSELAKNNFDNGKWNLLTIAITRDFSSLSLRHFIPLLFVSAILLPTLFSLWIPKLLFVALATMLTHSIFILLVISKMTLEKTKRLNLFITFKVLHWSYGLGSLIGLISSIPVWLKKQNA